jgi:hypothetical protein
MSESLKKKDHPNMVKWEKNINSETSKGIFLTSLFLPIDFPEIFPDFKSKFQGQNGERKFSIYFTDR